jgi:hypothetical protein
MAFCSLGFALMAAISHAQSPELRFKKDSVRFGEHLHAVLSYQHDPAQEVLFPDSNYSYAPFEFVSKSFYPTSSDSASSMDSVVYVLRTFEDLEVYKLSLPVMIMGTKDTVKLYSEADSAFFKPFITAPSDTLKLISNTIPLALDTSFNFWILAIVIGFLILMVLASYLLFGKRIWKEIKRYRIRLAHERFLKQFDQLNNQSMTVVDMETLVSLWKKYIEKLSDKPITTHTSAEIATQLKNESLKKNLQNIDVAIYSGRNNQAGNQDFVSLRQTAKDLYVNQMKA